MKIYHLATLVNCSKTVYTFFLPAFVKCPMWVEEHDFFDDGKDDQLQLEQIIILSFSKPLLFT
jgi:hypothetical protein